MSHLIKALTIPNKLTVRLKDEDDIIVVESDPESSSENCTDDEQRRSSTDESEVMEHSENWEQENEAQTAEKKPRLKDTKAMLRQMKVAVRFSIDLVPCELWLILTPNRCQNGLQTLRLGAVMMMIQLRTLLGKVRRPLEARSLPPCASRP